MGGYKHCKNCGRRYLALDDSDYCSPSCFSLESTKKERKPSKLIFYIPITCLFLLVFFLFEDLHVNYFFLTELSFLRPYAKSTFTEAGHEGVFFLHDRFADADEDTCLIIVQTLGDCQNLDRYKWKPKLLDEVDELYHSDWPDYQAAALRLYCRAKALPRGRQFSNELFSSRLSALVWELFKKVPEPRLCETLYQAMKDPSFEDEHLYDVIEILKNMDDEELRNGKLCLWLVKNEEKSKIRREAIMALSSILWNERQRVHSRRGRDTFIRLCRALKRVATLEEDETVRAVARQAIALGKDRKRAFVEHSALKLFEDLFEGSSE